MTPTHTPAASHSPTPTGTQSHPIQGDLNCDGSVNDGDFEFLMEYVAGLNDGTTPDDCLNLGDAEPISGYAWGDVNCDGFMNALDALFVLAHRAAVDLTPAQGNCFPIGSVITQPGFVTTVC